MFTLGVLAFEHSTEKTFRIESMERKLNTYADISFLTLSKTNKSIQETLDSLTLLFPNNIRLTLIDIRGNVLYDNAIQDFAKMDNHLDRPELAKARKNNQGSHIRKSNSTKQEYIYYAKRLEDKFIRVALPYNNEVKSSLASDHLFLYFVIGLFVLFL
ncbi:MAG: two-component sensor histidine kinase, partial [Bacteroidetes bacterium HGW-Bacteroidetes-20]